MIGIVIVTHGRLGAELLSAVQHIVGPQSHVETVGIDPDDDVEERREAISAAIAAVDLGSGIVLVTDMFGGTPCNLAISLLENGRVEVVAGVNLPMLVKLARIRNDSSLETAVVKAQEAGRKYINIASQILSG